MRTVFFCDTTQRVVVISYRRFGTSCWVDRLYRNVGKKYHYSLHNIPEELSSEGDTLSKRWSQLPSGRRQKNWRLRTKSARLWGHQLSDILIRSSANTKHSSLPLHCNSSKVNSASSTSNCFIITDSAALACRWSFCTKVAHQISVCRPYQLPQHRWNAAFMYGYLHAAEFFLNS
jgi:hypothetical protein